MSKLSMLSEKTELLIRKMALKDVEIWLNQQYLEIQNRINEIESEEQS